MAKRKGKKGGKVKLGGSVTKEKSKKTSKRGKSKKARDEEE
jgi:hypothetical protein